MYHKLRLDSQFHSTYVYGALECAASKLKLYKKLKKKPNAKRPYVSKNHLILNNQSYKLEQNIIRIPVRREKYVFIRLARYVCERINNTKLGNVTITDDRIVISYSKYIPEQKPNNFIGIDRNLDNVTTWDSKRNWIVHDLSKAQKIITSYGMIKSKFKRNDSRIRKRIFPEVWQTSEE